jgi:hypothetical protein
MTDVGTARSKIEAADLSNEATIDALAGIRFTPAGKQAARDVLAAGASGDVLWAATWVYASSAQDPAPLLPLLQNTDPTIRALSAAALVALGERAGFAALRASVPSVDPLRGSLPAMTVGDFAVATLTRYVETTEVPADWDTWLGQHAEQLQFDPSHGVWKLP